MTKSKQDLIDELMAAAGDGDMSDLKKCLQDPRITVDIHDEENNNRTALHVAASNGCKGIVKYLLSLGANPYSQDDDGDTPADDARNNDEREIAFLLTEWSLMGSSKLVHMERSDVASLQMKEIFNLESRERTTVVESLDADGEASVEATLPPVTFDDLPEPLLKKVFQQFTRLGGVADENFILHNRLRLEGKSSSPLQSGRK